MSLLAMPLEIRQTVYAHLLVSKEGLKPWERGVRRSCRTRYNLHPAILRTCRQIYDEAYPFLLKNNVFVHQSVFSYTRTISSLYSGDNDIYAEKQSHRLEEYQAPSPPQYLSNIFRLDLVRHLELKYSSGFDRHFLSDTLFCVASRCLLKTLRLELWGDCHQEQLEESVDPLMKLEVSDRISVTLLIRRPAPRDLTIKMLDGMLANGRDGWLYDVRSANLEANRGDKYPFLPKHTSQVGEWVLVPRRERAGGSLTHLPNE